jgi:hypothetical protein
LRLELPREPWVEAQESIHLDACHDDRVVRQRGDKLTVP